MNTSDRERLVGGEPVEVLRMAFSHFEVPAEDAQGMVLDATIPRDQAVPFMRALMRVEAELLLHEADNLTEGAQIRSPNDRAVDAFTALLRRIADEDCT